VCAPVENKELTAQYAELLKHRRQQDVEIGTAC
jgi:hypothetical protein